MYRPLFFALLSCFCLFAVHGRAQDEHPEIFSEPSIVTIGAQHVETVFTWASGKWSDAGKDIGTTSTQIDCYQKFSFCTDAEAYSLSGQAWVNFALFDILRWDNHELIAVDSSPICQVNEIRFDFKTKQVSVTESPKGETKDPFYKGLKGTTAYLGGIDDELRRLNKEPTKQK